MMSESRLKTNQVVFALATTARGPVVVLGVPDAAWEYMKDGRSHTFGLRKVGFPVDIIMFGGRTRAHILDALSVVQNGGDVASKLDTTTDFAIPEDERAVVKMRNSARAALFQLGFGSTAETPDAVIDELCARILGAEPTP